LQAGGEKRKESALWFLQYLKGLKNPYGKIHIRFGEGVQISDYIDNASGANVVDRRAMQKLAFDLAVDTNNATPITVNSLICYVLLENGHRAISFAHMKREINRLLNFIDIYDFPMTEEASRITDKVLKQALRQLAVNSVIDIAEDGLDDVYMIPHGKARLAAYYRNGLIQFFITSAVAELAALSVQSKGADAIKEFHQEALRIRDLMKYEFFFEGSEKFIETMEGQLDKRSPGWREALMSGRESVREMAQEQPLLIAHGTLRPFLEAYMVFAKVLSLVDADAEVDSKDLIKQSLALGHQGVLQQRIHCEESVSQNYFENAVKIADGRGLFNPGEDIVDKRHMLVGELKAMIVNTRFLASVTDSRRNDELTSIPL
jgi:Glycerol-3-phosphate O-acyltransferase